jgi:hypothetical protein
MTIFVSRADIMAWRKAERRRLIEERSRSIQVNDGGARPRSRRRCRDLSTNQPAIRSAPIGRFRGNRICGLG